MVAARGIGWGRNSLRGRGDRIGYAARLTAVGLAVVALLLAVVVGELDFRQNTTTVDAQATVSRQVTATLTQDAPILVSLGNRPATDLVRARWNFAGPHHGLIDAAQGSHAGSTMRIWVNPAGDRIRPPVTETDAVRCGWLAGAVAFVAALVVLFGALWLVEWRLSRARMRCWDSEWQLANPQWMEKPAGPLSP